MRLGVVVALAIAVTPSSNCSEDCPDWKTVVQSIGFEQYVIAATETARLDIAMPKAFDQDDVRFLNQWLMRTRISVRCFTRHSGLCSDHKCMDVRNDRRVLMVVICRSTFWEVLWDIFSNPYVSYLCVVAARYDDSISLVSGEQKLKNQYIHRIRGPGIFNFTVRTGRLLVTENYELQCLNYSEVPKALLPYHQDLTLGGVNVYVGCLHPYICEHPAFQSLAEVIRSKNASFQAFEFRENKAVVYAAVVQMQIYPAAMVDFPTLTSVGLMFPGARVPCHYGSSGFSAFVAGLKPFSKEMVLLLPFNPSVWFSFMSCGALCLLVILLIRKVHGGPLECAPFYPFVATLMSQSFTLSKRNPMRQSYKVVLGIWVITTFVMTVGFRACLTSFLNDIPLEGKLVDFTSAEDLTSRGFRICALSYAEETVYAGTAGGEIENLNLGRACFDSAGKIRIEDDGRDVFFVYGSGSKRHDILKKELVSRSYV